MTTKEWLEEYLNNIESQNRKYISLLKATEICNYSQPYLNLRIRQGKLKAVKFGRNWMTTEEWLKDYLRKVEQYEKETGKIIFKKLNLKKSNELLGRKNADISEVVGVVNFKKIFLPQTILATMAVIGITALIFAGLVVGNYRVPTVKFEKLSAQAYQFIAQTFSNYFKWVSERISHLAINILNWSDNMTNAPPGENQGLVVVPSTEKNKELEQKIKSSFSDEVKVEQTDESSGFITPVFKDKECDKYLYMMVPVNN